MTGRDILEGLALSDHMGDVNDYIPFLCDLLGEPRPTWNDRYNHWEFPWEDLDNQDEQE